jgi:hypothetical protein
MSPANRQSLEKILKRMVADGFGGDPKWLTPEQKQAYNDAMSGMLQNFIPISEGKSTTLP